MDDRTTAIWNRKDVPLRQVSLRKMLESKEMGNYYSVCCNRILQEAEVDDEYIYISPNFDDIALTDGGMCIYSHILLSYLYENTFFEIYEDIRKHNKNLAEENIVYEAFIEMGFIEVLKLIKKTKIKDNLDFSKDTFNYVIWNLIYELLSRNPINILRIKISNKITTLIDKARILVFSKNLLS